VRSRTADPLQNLGQPALVTIPAGFPVVRTLASVRSAPGRTPPEASITVLRSVALPAPWADSSGGRTHKATARVPRESARGRKEVGVRSMRPSSRRGRRVGGGLDTLDRRPWHRGHGPVAAILHRAAPGRSWISPGIDAMSGVELQAGPRGGPQSATDDRGRTARHPPGRGPPIWIDQTERFIRCRRASSTRPAEVRVQPAAPARPAQNPRAKRRASRISTIRCEERVAMRPPRRPRSTVWT
jgi:hypothetical protein